tara:strand:+ start:400 stop:930 length:531 start_codon:yes stop_codon:yes gene_type:complete
MKTQENKIEFHDDNLKLDYDEVSPITENKCVIVEADDKSGEEHRMCMESGFVTRTSLVPNSKACSKHEMGCSELMKRLQMVDMRLNSVWYPTFMQGPNCMLYCEGNGATPSDYNWSLAKVVPIVGDERLKYPVVGKTDEYHTSRLDVDNAEKFPGYSFETALDAFYKTVQETTNEN